MDDAVQHTSTIVDGNALAGLLSEVFAVDTTLMVTTCRSCGSAYTIAQAVVERDAVCSIVRCRGCSRTLFTVLHGGDGLRIDVGTLSVLRTSS